MREFLLVAQESGLRAQAGLICVGLILIGASSAAAQYPIAPPAPPPPSGGPPPGDDCTGGQQCPLTEEEQKSADFWARNPAPPTGVATSSPMPFFAVGDGAGDGSSNVYRFELSGGIVNFTHIGEAGTILWDVAIDPNGSPWGPLYAIGQNRWLYRIDQFTGTVTAVGSTGYSLNALEFCGGGLYAWGDNFFLIRLDPATGRPISINNRASHRSSGDLMCAPSGFLYGIASSSGNDQIVVFNTTFGYSSWVGATLPAKGFFGGEFDGMGQMWIARSSGSYLYLYNVEPSTWAATFVASYGTSYGLNGLTTFPAAW